MLFRTTGCTTDTVTTGTTAQKQDDIACCRALTTNIRCGTGTYHSTYFQTLGGIARVENLTHMGGSETNLVAVA